MDVGSLIRGFRRIGADVDVLPMLRRARRAPLAIDVVGSGRREKFEVEVNVDAQARVVDVDAELRHLLIHSTLPDDAAAFKYLCGHDERHWFVAGVPNDPGVSGVRSAMEALKPRAVQLAQQAAALDGRERLRRRNRAFVRQGEWFFVPCPELEVDPRTIRRNEPLQRSFRNKPHWAQEACRMGGTAVMVSDLEPGGLTLEQYRVRITQSNTARNARWRPMMRDPKLYVRGCVRHTDHATIELEGWHRVFMNEEARAPSSTGVVFLD